MWFVDALCQQREAHGRRNEMKVKIKWIWSLWEGLLIVIPLVLLFINWRWGLIAGGICLALFILWCILILNVGLNTRCPFGVARMIHLNDSLALRDADRKRIQWIETQGEPRELTTSDGLQLEGRLLRHPQSRGLIYVCHGFGDYQYASVQNPVEKFYELGYSVFVSHSRGFSRKGGMWTGMGILERKDHVQWLKTLHEEMPDSCIFLYGVSMGAASVMNLCDLQDDLPIRGIIEDCGYVSLYEQMDHSLRSVLQLPEYPVLPAADLLCRQICRYSLKGLDVRQKLAQSRWPILAIHGRDDDFVPFQNLDQVVASGGQRVIEAYHIDGAAHCQSFVVAPEFYWDRVSRFLERCTSYQSYEAKDFTALYHFEELQDQTDRPEREDEQSRIQ